MSNMTSDEWQEFSRLLDSALDLPDADREGWLKQLSEAKPAVADRILHALSLRDIDAYGQFLSKPTPMLADHLAASTLIGSHVGPYVIEDEIGRGGMGSVWRARRADGRFDGLAAIKFLHLALVGREGERRFRTEGSVLSRLDHPHIVRLLDAGVTQGRQPYLVLEYVAGAPIDTYSDGRSLDLAARLRLFIDVLGAVAHAHNQLVVHGDLKPANIFVTPDGVVKLFDFGIAKLLDVYSGTPLTQSGLLAMTPLYAAPEQLLGQPLSVATDIYTLGNVLYQLVTGRHPVTSDIPSTAEIARTVIGIDPPLPSESARLPNILPRFLHGDIDNIVCKALKKNPSERYESVTGFADDINRYLSNQPVYARPDTLRYRTSKFVRRNRGSVLAASLTLVLLLLATVVSFWQLRVARAQRDLALAEARRADSVGEFMTLMVGNVGRLVGTQTLRQELDWAHSLAMQQKFDDPLVKANLLRYIAGRYTESGDPATAVAILGEARAAMLSVNDPVSTAQLDCSIADLDDDLQREAAADVIMREATALLDNADDVRPQVRADCRVIESYLQSDRGHNELAVATAEQAVAELEHAKVRVGLQHDTAINALARAQAYAGHNAAAVGLLRKLRADDALQGRDKTVGGWIHGLNEARGLLAGGRVVEALTLATTLQQQSRQFGTDQGDALNIALLRVKALMASQQFAAAEALLNTAAGSDKVGLEGPLLRMELALQRRDFDSAGVEYAARRVAIEEAIRENRTLGVAAIRIQARLLIGTHQNDKAEILLAHAATLAIDADGNPTPEMRLVNALRVENALELGRNQLACDRATQVEERATAEAVDSSSSAWVGEALLLQARCHMASGETDIARDNARQAARHLGPNLGETHPLTVLARSLAGG